MYVPVTGDFAIDPRNVPLAVQANTFASCLKRGGNGNLVPTARGYKRGSSAAGCFCVHLGVQARLIPISVIHFGDF